MKHRVIGISMAVTRPVLPRMGRTYERIYAAVKRIPRGRVATYGQIASVACLPGQPRQVGYALNALPHSRSIPWHRVINAKGEISQRSKPGCDMRQRALLEHEGIEFDADGRVSLSTFRWRPRSWRETQLVRKRHLSKGRQV